MSVYAQCPACGERFRRPNSLAGKLERCPKCRHVFRLPTATSDRGDSWLKAKPTVESPPPAGPPSPPETQPIELPAAQPPEEPLKIEAPKPEPPRPNPQETAPPQGEPAGVEESLGQPHEEPLRITASGADIPVCREAPEPEPFQEQPGGVDVPIEPGVADIPVCREVPEPEPFQEQPAEADIPVAADEEEISSEPRGADVSVCQEPPSEPQEIEPQEIEPREPEPPEAETPPEERPVADGAESEAPAPSGDWPGHEAVAPPRGPAEASPWPAGVFLISDGPMPNLPLAPLPELGPFDPPAAEPSADRPPDADISEAPRPAAPVERREDDYLSAPEPAAAEPEWDEPESTLAEPEPFESESSAVEESLAVPIDEPEHEEPPTAEPPEGQQGIEPPDAPPASAEGPEDPVGPVDQVMLVAELLCAGHSRRAVHAELIANGWDETEVCGMLDAMIKEARRGGIKGPLLAMIAGLAVAIACLGVSIKVPGSWRAGGLGFLVAAAGMAGIVLLLYGLWRTVKRPPSNPERLVAAWREPPAE